MCLSIFLAQLIGIYLILVSLSVLIHPHRFKKIMHDFLASAPFLAVSGCVLIFLGLLVLIPHHLWVLKWPVLITILGWVSLLRGFFHLFFPVKTIQFSKQLIDSKGFLLIAWVTLLVGLYLSWIGFTQ